MGIHKENNHANIDYSSLSALADRLLQGVIPQLIILAKWIRAYN